MAVCKRADLMLPACRHVYCLLPLLLVLALVSSVTTAVSAGSTIGFSPAFTSSSTPFGVTECDAACTSPGSVTLSLTLVRSGDLSATDTVHVSTRATTNDDLLAATAGNDYTPLIALPVVFAPTESTKTVSITIVSDGVYEDDEYLEVFLSNPSTGVTLDPSASVAYIAIQDGGDGGWIALRSLLSSMGTCI